MFYIYIFNIYIFNIYVFDISCMLCNDTNNLHCKADLPHFLFSSLFFSSLFFCCLLLTFLLFSSLPFSSPLLSSLVFSSPLYRYLGTAQSEKFLFIILEYVPGGSIQNMLAQFGVFSESLIW